MKKKLTALFLTAVITFILFSGCTTADNINQPTQSQKEGVATKEITDMAGRKVAVPTSVDKVFGTDPVGTITLYTLAPHKLIGWNYELNDEEKANIPEKYQQYSVFGMKDTLNAEAIISANPQIIVQMGSVSGEAGKQADSLQEKLNIPVVVISGKLLDIPKAYEMLGQITGDTEKATELRGHAQRILDMVTAKEIPTHAQESVYYGNGVDSLETAPKGSDAAEVIETAMGSNVAVLDMKDPNERITIGKEQIIAWNPTIMFVNGEPKKSLTGGGAAQSILKDADLAGVAAVKEKRVYGIPKSPFSWLDRPKAPNRLIGLLWTGSLMYPEAYKDVDIIGEIQQFYTAFYHVDLTKEQVAKLLGQ